jgi:tripartite ATP-independent transporter DctP family solute receptor
MLSFKKAAPAVALTAAGMLVLAGCSTGGDSKTGNGDAPAETVTLKLSTSWGDDHPHNRCGVLPMAEKINAADIGMKIDVFTNSTLGSDVDRFTSVMEGDIDIDMPGSSAISNTYAPIGVLDSAYAFSGPDHMFEFFDSGASEQLEADMLEATNTRVIEPFFFGMRNFSANSAIRTPEDLQGVRMRFPDSPTYLANAEAMGAEAVAVAFEELFLALQQGVADGQENPIPTVSSMSLDEVQSHVNMSQHQTGFQLAVINNDRWESLTDEQQTALEEGFAEAREADRKCIDEAEEEIIADWEDTGAVEVVKDVDRAAFEKKAEKFFTAKYTGADLELYKSIRASAP